MNKLYYLIYNEGYDIAIYLTDITDIETVQNIIKRDEKEGDYFIDSIRNAFPDNQFEIVCDNCNDREELVEMMLAKTEEFETTQWL